MPSVLPASQVFLGCDEPSVTASVTASSYVDWKLQPAGPQPYRGTHLSRPSTPSLPSPPANRAKAEREQMRTEIFALTSRVAALQVELQGRELEPSEVVAVNAAVASISARLHALEMSIVEDSEEAARPLQSSNLRDSKVYLDSCAKYASEASRMRITGRVPFGSDYFKIG
mmetsp:Transcript_20268/g.61745  ORF Transcript_20268/g.61745 Transcript_20268/m.61745 type:complete len:171 (+) Transcript_20268:53-565(+)